MYHLAPAGTIVLVLASPAGASRLAAGDSIAVGLGPALGCAVAARVGASSAPVVARVRPGYGLMVISAGSDDLGNLRLVANLRAMRARASGRVVWIVPANAAAAAVRAVAAEHGDRTAGFTAGPHGIHPASYRALARSLRGDLR